MSVGKVAGLVVLLVLGGVLAERFGSITGSTDVTDVKSVLEINENRTDQGGSAFAPSDPTNPIGYAQAMVTVLFRPFPTETGGIEQTAAAIEATILLCLVIASRRRLATIPGRLRREPYVTFALCYVLMFIFGFGSIANFGILARQRSQVVVFLFVLVSLTAAPKVVKSTRQRGQARATTRVASSSRTRAVES